MSKTTSFDLALKEIADLDSKLCRCEIALEAALVANEQSRTAVAEVVSKLKMVVTRRQWLLEGRGPYEFDDDQYREEFSRAIQEWMQEIEVLEAVAKDWKHCPTDPDEIAAARTVFRDELAKRRADEE